MKQKLFDSHFELELKIQAATIPMKSVLKTSNSIHLNSELNTVLGFINRLLKRDSWIRKTTYDYTTDKVLQKYDCVDGSLVNEVREHFFKYFLPFFTASPGYKVSKKPTTVLNKNIHKTRLDKIQFFLEPSNYSPVDFSTDLITLITFKSSKFTFYLFKTIFTCFIKIHILLLIKVQFKILHSSYLFQ